MGTKFDGMCPHCKGQKTEKLCKFCEGKGTLKFEMASQQSVDYLSTYTELVMKIIEKISEIPPGSSWISDESTVGDFPIEDKELKLLEDELGFPVQYEDKIIDIAKKLKDA